MTAINATAGKAPLLPLGNTTSSDTPSQVNQTSKPNIFQRAWRAVTSDTAVKVAVALAVVGAFVALWVFASPLAAPLTVSAVSILVLPGVRDIINRRSEAAPPAAQNPAESTTAADTAAQSVIHVHNHHYYSPTPGGDTQESIAEGLGGNLGGNEQYQA